jgi:hypothetical protein
LVPLAVDPNALAWRSGEDAAGEANTVVFKLAVRCSRAADGSMVNDKGEPRPDGIDICYIEWSGSTVCWCCTDTI